MAPAAKLSRYGIADITRLAAAMVRMVPAGSTTPESIPYKKPAVLKLLPIEAAWK